MLYPLALLFALFEKGLASEASSNASVSSRGRSIRPLTSSRQVLSVVCQQKINHFLQVNVNGNDYMPTVAVDNKKKAKSNAAMACLQQMGLVPKDPDNPV